MKRKIFLLIILFLLIAQSYEASAQFAPIEIAQREQWEELLKTAEIIKYGYIGKGVTKPMKLTLKKENIEITAVWKNPRGMQRGFFEGWQYEIAAYEIDKLLELNMIPPTVERNFKGRTGSLQLWIEHDYSDLDLMEKKIGIPRSKFDRRTKMKYIARAFDSLIGNEDRTQQNIIYTKDWRMLLIDHSRSFRYYGKYIKRLMFGKKGIQGRRLFKRLPRAFVEKIKGLNYDNIKKAVGPYLKEKEIKAIVIRRELLLKEIEEMIKEQGEDKVLY